MTNQTQQIPGPKNADGVFDTISGHEIRWADQRGLVHVVVGADVQQGIRLLWTLCSRDVPTDKAFLLQSGMSHEMCVTCMKHHRTEQKIREEEAREERAAHGQFGVGA